TILFSIDTSPADSYPLSLHDALPICPSNRRALVNAGAAPSPCRKMRVLMPTAHLSHSSSPSTGQRRTTGTMSARAFVHRRASRRSEEHTSELQSRENLVCRLLLEKKK